MIIEAWGVTKQFGDTVAVDNVSFQVKKGDVVGFVGANGAGKSTTINMLLGFINPSGGQVSVLGESVHPASAHQRHRRIGFAAGDMTLPARLTGEQYLRFVTHQYGEAATKRLKQLEAIFQPQLEKKIGALSRGNKQKIALIAAFLPKPDLVILDEPTSGLDPIMQEKFLDLVRQEQARGATIFMSSHYLNEVADVCSRIILMRRGRLIEDVSAEALLKQSGKTVRIVSGYGRTVAPSGADNATKSRDASGNTVVEFTWKREPAQLQHWLAGVKQLLDIEVTEFNLETAFKGMYDDEEAAS